MLRLVMLTKLSGFVVARGRDDERTHLGPSPFCWEDVGTMGTTEPMVYFIMLRGC